MGKLRQIFSPSRNIIWSQIADEIGGEYIAGGFWKNDKLEFRHKEWLVVLDTYTITINETSKTFTRIRAPFINKDGLYFNIYKEGFFSTIGKFFGMQDIVIGAPSFDEFYIIKSNNEEKIKKLLKPKNIKRLILYFESISVSILDNEKGFFHSFPEDVDILSFVHSGVIHDRKSLLMLFTLFSTVLERLVQIDSAYEDDPSINLD